MFSMMEVIIIFLFRKKIGNDLKDLIEQNTRRIKMGELRYIQNLLDVYNECTKEYKIKIAKLLCELLDEMSAIDIHLCGLEMRNSYYTYSGQFNSKWSLNNFLSTKEQRALLIFLSVSKNGYDRQWALSQLKYHDKTFVYIVLRIDDWVNVIREEAMFSYYNYYNIVKDDDIYEAFDVFCMLNKSTKYNNQHIVKYLDTLFKLDSLTFIINKFISSDYKNKKNILELICKSDNKAFNMLIYETILAKEKHPHIRYLVYKLLCDTASVNNTVALMFREKYHLTLKMAITKSSEHGTLTKEILLPLIYTNNSGLRNLAVWHILKLDSSYNIIDNYINKLKVESNSEILSSCIRGIGYYGSKEHAYLLEEFLESKNPSILKSTLITLSFLSYDDYISRIVTYLKCENLGVVKTVLNILFRKNESHYYNEIEELFYKTTDLRIKNLCLKILSRQTFWTAIELLLKHVNDSDFETNLPYVVLKSIVLKTRYINTSLTKEEADNLEVLLKNKLYVYDNKLYETLLFILTKSTIDKANY